MRTPTPTGEQVPGSDSAAEIDETLAGLRFLGEPRIRPLLLAFYDAYDQQDIDRDAFVRVLKATEAYVLRRAVCDCPDDDLALFCSGIIARLDGWTPRTLSVPRRPPFLLGHHRAPRRRAHRGR